MSDLEIYKLQSGAFKHVDSIDGEFFLGRFSFKNEFAKAFIVEAYGAKRREYVIGDITVYDYLGSAETFTNFTDLINRLVALNYTGIDTNNIVNGFLSDDVADYTDATLPLTGTEVAILNDGTNWVKITWDNIKAQLKIYFDTVYKAITDVLTVNATTTGTYNLDWSKDTWDLILTGNTTFTESNLPASGKTKVISLYVTGSFTLTLPSGWSTNVIGTYDGSVLNQIVVEYISTGKYFVMINQPD